MRLRIASVAVALATLTTVSGTNRGRCATTFFDDFDRADLGPNYAVEGPAGSSVGIVANKLQVQIPGTQGANWSGAGATTVPALFSTAFTPGSFFQADIGMAKDASSPYRVGGSLGVNDVQYSYPHSDPGGPVAQNQSGYFEVNAHRDGTGSAQITYKLERSYTVLYLGDPDGDGKNSAAVYIKHQYNTTFESAVIDHVGPTASLLIQKSGVTGDTPLATYDNLRLFNRELPDGGAPAAGMKDSLVLSYEETFETSLGDPWSLELSGSGGPSGDITVGSGELRLRADTAANGGWDLAYATLDLTHDSALGRGLAVGEFVEVDLRRGQERGLVGVRLLGRTLRSGTMDAMDGALSEYMAGSALFGDDQAAGPRNLSPNVYDWDTERTLGVSLDYADGTFAVVSLFVDDAYAASHLIETTATTLDSFSLHVQADNDTALEEAFFDDLRIYTIPEPTSGATALLCFTCVWWGPLTRAKRAWRSVHCSWEMARGNHRMKLPASAAPSRSPVGIGSRSSEPRPSNLRWATPSRSWLSVDLRATLSRSWLSVDLRPLPHGRGSATVPSGTAMTQSLRYTIVELLAALIGLAAASSSFAADQPEFADALATLRAVRGGGEGHAAAVKAYPIVARAPTAAIPKILAALDGANPIAANWLRATAEAMVIRARKNGEKPPLAALLAYLHDTDHNPHGRRMAYEIIKEADPQKADELLPGFLHDPSLELRRDAVAALLTAAAAAAVKLKEVENDPSADAAFTQDLKAKARRQWQTALLAARDLDQIDAAKAGLESLGEKIDLAKTLGFITTWKVVGPFDNVNGVGFAKAYPPEAEFDADAAYHGKNKDVQWRSITAKDAMGLVEFNAILGKQKGVVAYARAVFPSEGPQRVELRLSSYNANKVWLNGALLGANEVYHAGEQFDQYVCKGELVKGENAILVKICQNEQTDPWADKWRFNLRVTDELGTPVK